MRSCSWSVLVQETAPVGHAGAPGLLDQLDAEDSEHTDVAVSHESGATLQGSSSTGSPTATRPGSTVEP
jgi:hypothetical protein